MRRVLLRLRRRVRGFHADRRGQLLPLVFALGLALFTSVILVVNSGRMTTSQIRAQNAADAAAISAASQVARGMNYVAQNNITQARVLATVVVLRSLKTAAQHASLTLSIVGPIALALSKVPFPPVAIPASVVTWKIYGTLVPAAPVGISAERAALPPGEFWVLNRLRNALDGPNRTGGGLVELWDNGGKFQLAPPKGAAWGMLQVLTKLGDLLVAFTPMTAEATAREVYEMNLGSQEKGRAYTVPLYPRLPLCRAEFGKLYTRTRRYTEKHTGTIVGVTTIALTFSLYPLYYSNAVGSELQRLFTGSGRPETMVNDPQMEQAERDGKRITQLTQEIAELEEKKAQAARDERPDEVERLDAQIRSKESERDVLTERTRKLLEKRSAGGPKPNTDLGKPPSAGSFVKRDDVYPYEEDAKDWPIAFTYSVVGFRNLPSPVLPYVFAEGISPGEGTTYASARLFNSTTADAWTPDWRAKLVRSRSAYFAFDRALGLSSSTPGCEDPEELDAVGAFLLLQRIREARKEDLAVLAVLHAFASRAGRH